MSGSNLDRIGTDLSRDLGILDADGRNLASYHAVSYTPPVSREVRGKKRENIRRNLKILPGEFYQPNREVLAVLRPTLLPETDPLEDSHNPFSEVYHQIADLSPSPKTGSRPFHLI